MLLDAVDHALLVIGDAGEALRELRDSRLYRNTHKSWEHFIREQWPGLGHRHANNLISAAEVRDNLADMKKPTHLLESHARELSALPPSQQREVWEKAHEAAPETRGGVKKVTAEVVRKARREVVGEQEPVDDGLVKCPTCNGKGKIQCETT